MGKRGTSITGGGKDINNGGGGDVNNAGGGGTSIIGVGEGGASIMVGGGGFNNGGGTSIMGEGTSIMARVGVDFNIWTTDSSTIIHKSSKHVHCDLKCYQHS